MLPRAIFLCSSGGWSVASHFTGTSPFFGVRPIWSAGGLREVEVPPLGVRPAVRDLHSDGLANSPGPRPAPGVPSGKVG